MVPLRVILSERVCQPIDFMPTVLEAAGLEQWLKWTGDPALAAYRNRGSAEALERFLSGLQAAADKRKKKK